jgi:hypothetical protein
VTQAPDPLRMFLVVRRGAVTSIAEGGVLAGAAAVACVRRYADTPAMAEWRPRPGKVCLRARGGQWDELLASEPEAFVVEDAVACLPPRRRSERGPLLERMQAMTTAVDPAPDEAGAAPVTYVLNPRLEMSSGKTLAQIAHAAVMVGDALPSWPGRPAAVVSPAAARFDALCDSGALRVVDAGLTEVAPGTVTVLAVLGGSPADHPRG